MTGQQHLAAFRQRTSSIPRNLDFGCTPMHLDWDRELVAGLRASEWVQIGFLDTCPKGTRGLKQNEVLVDPRYHTFVCAAEHPRARLNAIPSNAWYRLDWWK